jgi:hypothetical protein
MLIEYGVDYAILKCTDLLKRKLTDSETLIVGQAYNMGYGAGFKHQQDQDTHQIEEK